jgi:hypothetical protein
MKFAAKKPAKKAPAKKKAAPKKRRNGTSGTGPRKRK